MPDTKPPPVRDLAVILNEIDDLLAELRSTLNMDEGPTDGDD